MKKKIFPLLLIMLLALSMPLAAMAEQKELTRDERLVDTVVLQLGNKYAAVEGTRTRIYQGEDIAAFSENSRTYVPIRFIAESLGAQVDWISETETVKIVKGDKTIEMVLNEEEFLLNGEALAMDAPAISQANRVFVPIRFVAEALQMDVQWLHANSVVIISPLTAPWNMFGAVEQELFPEILFIISPVLSGFTN